MYVWTFLNISWARAQIRGAHSWIIQHMMFWTASTCFSSALPQALFVPWVMCVVLRCRWLFSLWQMIEISDVSPTTFWTAHKNPTGERTRNNKYCKPWRHLLKFDAKIVYANILLWLGFPSPPNWFVCETAWAHLYVAFFQARRPGKCSKHRNSSRYKLASPWRAYCVNQVFLVMRCSQCRQCRHCRQGR